MRGWHSIITAEIEAGFVPNAETVGEISRPAIEITYSFRPGQPAHTPRGEYGPIDPPDPPEVDLISARLIDGDGLTLDQARVQELALGWLESDVGYQQAIDNAERERV